MACIVENGHTLLETVKGKGEVDYQHLHTNPQNADIRLARVITPRKVR